MRMMPMVELHSAEADLIDRLRGGDEAAFVCLVNAYSASLKRLALAFVPIEAVAEEVVQETWLAVLTGIARFEGRSSVKTWIFKILANRAKTRAIRERRTINFSELHDSFPPPTPRGPVIGQVPSTRGPRQPKTLSSAARRWGYCSVSWTAYRRRSASWLRFAMCRDGRRPKFARCLV